MSSAVAACPLCVSALPAVAGSQGAAKPHGVHWGYTGKGAPEHWGDLSPANRVCGVGLQQSPIDLTGAVDGDLGGIFVDYRPTPLHVVNNGHTIQVNTQSGSTVRIDGQTFRLVQFHFDHPSEHPLSGTAFDMEMHLVHVGESGDLAVLGVFMRPGSENTSLAPIWRAMPRRAGQDVRVSATLNPAALLPLDRRYLRYFGSLTTPPCSERVIWSVYRNPVEISAGQVAQFASLFANNARPVQPLNRRFLLQSG